MMDILERIDPDCHSTAHPVGRAATHLTHDIQLLLQACQDRCRHGCFHGVILGLVVDSYEGVFGEISREEQMVRWPVSQLWLLTPASGQGQGRGIHMAHPQLCRDNTRECIYYICSLCFSLSIPLPGISLLLLVVCQSPIPVIRDRCFRTTWRPYSKVFALATTEETRWRLGPVPTALAMPLPWQPDITW